MSADAMKVLVDEHEVISAARDAIAGLRPDAGEEYEKAARGVLTFLSKYGDGFHHQKEERVLFPALKGNPDFYSHELLDELEEHHQMFRDHIAGIGAALDEKRYEDAQSQLEAYVKELLDHIAVENDELFVMTEAICSDAELENIYYRFKDVDRELGEDVKKRLEASAENLKLPK